MRRYKVPCQVFSQIDEATTRQYEGTGLGLALVKSLTEEMQGSVGIDSEVGKGSTFWAEFPLIETPKSVVDVLVETAGVPKSGALIEVEYIVRSARWSPVYDLRAASDASSVRLVYRAEVVQQTRERWSDVELLLSTAQPHLGAQGPDPVTSWVNVVEPQRARKSGRGFLGSTAPMADASLESLGYAGEEIEEVD